ncbi:hypothetical protein ACOME3_004486 [Neoechinorhynchus agilis]
MSDQKEEDSHKGENRNGILVKRHPSDTHDITRISIYRHSVRWSDIDDGELEQIIEIPTRKETKEMYGPNVYDNPYFDPANPMRNAKTITQEEFLYIERPVVLLSPEDNEFFKQVNYQPYPQMVRVAVPAKVAEKKTRFENNLQERMEEHKRRRRAIKKARRETAAKQEKKV